MPLTWRETSPNYHVAETSTLRLVAFTTMLGLATNVVERKSEPHKLAAVGGVQTLQEAQITCERLAEQLGSGRAPAVPRAHRP